MHFLKNYLFYVFIFICQYEFDICQKVNLFLSDFYIQKTSFNHCSNMPLHYFKDNNLYFEDLYFEQDFFSCYIHITKHIKPNKIVINTSNGGSAVNAYLLSKYVKQNNIPLEINRSCASACTILLFHNKVIYKNDLKVLVHRGYIKIKDTKIITPIFDGKYHYDSKNYHYIYDIYKNNPFDKIQEISIEELIKNGIINNES